VRAVLATIVATCAIGAAAVAPSAGASASHLDNWATRGEKVVCGVASKVWGSRFDPGTMAQLNGYWPGLQCSALGIPRPRQGVGDPFVQLGQGQAGRARLVDVSQDDLVSSARYVALAPGSRWNSEGIDCTVSSSSIRCTNSAGHGMTLSPGHVHLF
jgi:hypothetical protein